MSEDREIYFVQAMQEGLREAMGVPGEEVDGNDVLAVWAATKRAVERGRTGGGPTLAVFGPTVPAFGFGPLAPGSVTAGVVDLACRPCDPHGPRVCPLGHWRCMRDQAPARIAEAARVVGAARR